MIGIIGAMPIEIENLKSLMTDVKIRKIGKVDYFLGKLNNVDCIAAFSGVGKVNSACCAHTMALIYNVKKIINIGVAGGLLEEMSTGDVVVSNSSVQYDIDTTALGDPLGLISTINVINLPSSKFLKEKAIEVLKEHENLNFYEGKIATGDRFVSKEKELYKIRNDFNSIACDMETASIAQVCYLNDLEFLSLRVISDNINKSNSHFDYEKFKLSSAKLACDIIFKMIKML